MKNYSHVLILSSETAERVSDKIVDNAGNYGVGLVVSDEKGLTPLSQDFNPQELERLNNVLPQGAEARKANGILHKLHYRVKENAAQENRENIAPSAIPAHTEDRRVY